MIKNSGNRTAIAFGSERITYIDLLRKVDLFAGLFDIESGQNMVVYAENRPGWIYAFYAIWKKHGVAIPIDFMATTAEVAYILKDSAPSVIFCSEDRHQLMSEAINLAGISPKVIIIDEAEKLTQENAEPALMLKPDQDETAVIIYTSGTTGSPKGVMLTYGNILTNVRAVSDHIPIYSPDSRVMILLPLHHVFPLVGTMIIPLSLGAMVAISPTMASEDIMATLKNNAVTTIIGVPRLYAAIRKGIMDKINKSALAKILFSLAGTIKSRKFSKLVFGTVHRKLGGSVEFLVSGGAALDPEVGRDFQVLGFEVLEGFGMTEAAPMITFTQPGRVRIGSPGEVMKETKVRIEDGEILASGPNIMKGYYHRPEETAEVLRDGWLYTGDLGYIDKDGYLYITGRKKEIIILSNGKNVNPGELESKLLESPLVKDCGVFFQQDTLQVILVPDTEAFIPYGNKSPDEVIRHEVIEPFNNSVSPYKKLMRFYLTSEELPRTRLGKLQRFKLQDLAIDKPEETEVAIEPETPEFKMIAAYLEAEKGRKVRPYHHLEMDLGMDSLDQVGFQAWLNQNFGVSIEPSEITALGDVKKLSEYVSNKKTRMEEGSLNWTDILHENVILKIPETWFTGSWIVYISRAFFRLYFRIKARGVENIPEAPFILAPNHQSYFDGLFVASYLKSTQIRNTYFYAKEEHIKQRWLKFLANRNNIIIVDLNHDLKESILKIAEVLKQKHNLVIFPEGTRTLTGELGQFKKTFAILSSELKIPVVPVSIDGAFKAMPKGRLFPRPGTSIRIEFMKPVYPGENSYDSITQQVKDQIAENIGK